MIGDLSGEEGCAAGAGGADSVEGGVDCFLHRRLPVQTPVHSGVDGALGRDHLCGARTGGNYGGRVS